MKTILKLAAVSAVVLPALTFIAGTGSAAVAKPASHPGGAYCLSYNRGGDQQGDCSFKTYAQCQASASGLNAECYANVFNRDDSDL